MGEIVWMANFSKKNLFETGAEGKQHRMQRKMRGYKNSISDKFERRHSWSYAKRRASMAE